MNRMRLIDADVLIEKIGIGKDCNECQHNEDEFYCNWKPDVVDICEAICTAPTVEPEQIRCENCKHCETTDNYIYCHEWLRETSIDGYCYKGDAND